MSQLSHALSPESAGAVEDDQRQSRDLPASFGRWLRPLARLTFRLLHAALELLLYRAGRPHEDDERHYIQTHEDDGSEVVGKERHGYNGEDARSRQDVSGQREAHPPPVQARLLRSNLRDEAQDTFDDRPHRGEEVILLGRDDSPLEGQNLVDVRYGCCQGKPPASDEACWVGRGALA